MSNKTINGLKTSIIISKTKTISISLTIKAGSMYEKINGTAHLIEHLLIKKISQLKNISIINEYGINYNAITGKKYVTIKLLCSKNSLCYCFDILSVLSIFDVTFNDIKDEVSIINQEILRFNRSIPHKYITDLLMKAYKGPYSLPVLGSNETLSKIKEEDVMNFYRERYIIENMALCVVGDVNENMIQEDIYKLSTLLKKDNINKKESELNTNWISNVLNSKINLSNENSKIRNLLIGIKTPSILDKYYFDNLVFKSIMLDNLNSVLMTKLRGERKLVYAIQSYIDSYTEEALSHLYIYINSSKENIEEIKDVLYNILQYVQKNKIGDYNIRKGVNKLKMDYYKNRDINYKYSTYKAKCILDNIVNDEKYYHKHIELVNEERILELVNSIYLLDKIILYEA
ncbi:M16 family metallopeptidase [Abyssisolibacter fermentans]|uniref:M16 family metallopeptidase n=1 Tax=Abyssisolibacter fermentans TaxID=1766203 RepID=UPI00082A4074|nr:insulinase family protein [Abyssisolibacter fermentans]